MSRTLLVPDLVLEPDGAVRAGCAVELVGGRIGAVVDAAGVGERADVVRLPGRLLAPGLVNGHSHAFQRHLRGRVEVRAPAAPEETPSSALRIGQSAIASEPSIIPSVSR